MHILEEYDNVDLQNHTFKNGDKALHIAIREQQKDFIMYILNKGLDPNIKNSETGNTPLHIATEIGDIGTITVLLTKNVDVNICNKNDKKAMDIAKELKNDDICEILDPKFKELMDKEKEKQKQAAELENMLDSTKDEDTTTIGDTLTDDNTNTVDKEYSLSHTDSEFTHDEEEDLLNSSFRVKKIPDKIIDDENKEESKTNNDDDKSKNDNSKDEKSNDNNNKDKDNNLKVNTLGLKREASIKALNTVAEIQKKEVNLPILGDWLEKKRRKAPYYYQKRYMCVVDGHMLWNDKKIKVNPNAKLDATERKKFAGSLSLMMVKGVRARTSKKKDPQWKFEILTKNLDPKQKQSRTYIWRAKKEEIRDKWINGIKEHCKHLNIALEKYDALADD